MSLSRLVFWLTLVACATGCLRSRSAPSGTHRVVSLSPSTTEAMFVIGAGEMLVGRSRYCDYPPGIETLPEVGGYVDPNFEAILALRPDLVVGARGPLGPQLVDRLEAHGTRTYFPQTETIDQIWEMLLGIGARTGRDAQARDAVGRLRAGLAAIEGALRDRPRPRALLVFGLQPIVVAGPRSFADAMLRAAGAVNVVAEGAGYPTLGIERVLALDPDVVLDGALMEHHGGERISPSDPGWKELRAVKAGRVLALSNESVLRPGPRVVDGIAELARALHPDVPIAWARP